MSESSKPKIPCAAADKWEAEAAQTQGPMAVLLRAAAAEVREVTQARGIDASNLARIHAAMQSSDALVAWLRALVAACERSSHSYDRERVQPIADALREMDEQEADGPSSRSRAAGITVKLPGDSNIELELTALEDHAYRRLLSLLGFEPLVAHIQICGAVVYGIHDEDGDVIAEGTTIGETIIDALYRIAADSSGALSELRQDVHAFRRAAAKLGLGE